MNVIVVGAGITGALVAYRLAQAGANVTVVEAAHPAAGASGASFGWINASFYLDAHHFHARHAAMAAHRRLAQDLDSTALRWQAALCWENQNEAFDAQLQQLQDMGYSVCAIDQDEFATLEPAVIPPERALLFADEGAVDLVQLTRDALDAAAALGCRLVSGVEATGIDTQGDSVCGLKWSGGTLPCDALVLATGTKTSRLLHSLDLSLPMLDRPGLMLRSAAIPPLLAHILVTPQGELRQDPTGRILAPTAAAHQSDQTEEVTENPCALADRRASEVSALLRREVVWEQVSMAHRPVPEDGKPVVGAYGPQGLYVTTMHSGATLAPLVSEIAAKEVCGQQLTVAQADLIAPYRPQRFTA